MSRMRSAYLPAPAVLLLGMLAAAPVAAQEAARPHITVSGEAAISVEPDLAQIRAGVTTDAKTAREAAEANSKAMTAVMGSIRALGVAERDLQTSRYAIQPIHEPGQPGRNRVVGFQATNSLLVKVRQPDRVGEIIDRLVASGANNVSGVEFVVSDPSKLLDDARAQAIADARRKAQLYATAAGATLGPAFSIAEQSAGMPPQPMMMARAAGAETPIAPGERTLRVSVTVTYELAR